ncbi:unnamed protein product [Alopecurus aequalis]
MHEEVIDPEANKETLRQLLKDMSQKLDILDHGGDDEKDEIDRGKSAIQERMPMPDVEFKSEMEAAESMDNTVDTNTTMIESDKLLLEPADPSTVEKFAEYSRDWDSCWGETYGFFTYITMLSPMQFTHYTPGLKAHGAAGSTPETLQIFSIELTEIAGGLEFPLSVYGVVAARDVVDRNRNILFSRDRSEAQVLKQQDRFLRLMGPTRAIVFTDRVDFEIELKVKGALKSQDKPLMSRWRRYRGNDGPDVSTISFKNVLCTLELRSQPVQDTIQATVLAIKVVEGPWPFEYGGRVTCSSLFGEFVFTEHKVDRTLEPSSGEIVLLESKGRAMPKGYGVYVHLSRQVVSVQREGALDVVIRAYSKPGARAKKGHVCFVPKFCNISQGECALGDAKVLITVAWSLVPTSKMELRNEITGRRRVFD